MNRTLDLFIIELVLYLFAMDSNMKSVKTAVNIRFSYVQYNKLVKPLSSIKPK